MGASEPLVDLIRGGGSDGSGELQVKGSRRLRSDPCSSSPRERSAEMIHPPTRSLQPVVGGGPARAGCWEGVV